MSVAQENSAGAPPIRVGLLWHAANSGNLGVGALTFGNLALLRRAAAKAGFEPRFTVLGFADPGRPRYIDEPDIEIFEIDRRAMMPGGGFGAALERCDLACDIGGGDSFTDIYGPKRFAFLWLTKLLANLRHIPLIFSPQTIGPFSGKLYRLLAGMALRRASIVYARDPSSAEAARKLAPSATIRQAVDVAFAMPFSRTRLPAGKTHIGINVSGLLFNRGYDGRNSFGLSIDYPVFIRSLLERLTADSHFEVHLIAHVNSENIPVDDDGRVADLLAHEFPQLIRVPDFADPVAAKSYISGLDTLVAARMHACIAAYSSGVATIPIAYSRKFAGLFGGALRYPHMVPVTGMTTAEAVEYVIDRIAQRKALAADIALGLRAVEGLLDGYVDSLAAAMAAAKQKS
ncbi:MAG: polysaccharide pyruvyl transferase family protein [Sphingopyxis sp.]|uniref:polysaccharide pyruvyl transferase family protein n=1 Tax=Sphingopyxis sp. TaxID=1908224 RepID=UPI002AB894D1|nr:polysaccharide pyruvyl transferase family protein [Sphingopyxis sp.]MDZ3833697.1 polysaccharide pyruvyl transferase family protein [Sphingopyxis sp.]